MNPAILFIILYAVLNVSGAALIKWRLIGRPLLSLQNWIDFIGDYHFVIAFALIVASALSLFKALSGNSLLFILPVATGFNFILTVLAGVFLFQDRFSLL